MNTVRGDVYPLQVALWIVAVIAFLATLAPVHASPLAQVTETPTPAPTAYVESVTLTSGRVLDVQYTWSFGEAWIFLATVAVLLVDLFTLVTGFARRWS